MASFAPDAVLEGLVLCLAIWLAELLLAFVFPNARRLFLPRYGRRHRWAGAAYLLLLVLGVADLAARLAPPESSDPSPGSPPPVADRPSALFAWAPRVGLGSPPLASARASLAFDLALGVAGVVLALTAAFEFKDPHLERRVRNVASGPLDPDQTVTHEEMLEHAFYQGLNLAQIAFLHLAASSAASAGSFGAPSPGSSLSAPAARARALALLAVTAPWLLRGFFPINRFSHNYTRPGRDPRALTSRLYRLKKWQYVSLKHLLQHGLNVAVATHTGADAAALASLARSTAFRAYWLALNAAFVIEFFAQTLVKRGYARQASALRVNLALMLASTGLAVVGPIRIAYCVHHPSALGVARVFFSARLETLVPALGSIALNFARGPGRELANVASVFAAAVCADGGWPPGWIVSAIAASVVLARVEGAIRGYKGRTEAAIRGE
jgi:hypothetical protein